MRKVLDFFGLLGNIRAGIYSHISVEPTYIGAEGKFTRSGGGTVTWLAHVAKFGTSPLLLK